MTQPESKDTNDQAEKMDFIDFLLSGPSFEGMDLELDKSPGRAPEREISFFLPEDEDGNNADP